MDINVGDFIKTKRKIAGKNGEIEIIDQYYLVLFVDETHTEVKSYGHGSPFPNNVVHEYEDSIGMLIVPDKDVQIETITKSTRHNGIVMQHNVAQRYVWQGKEVVIPFLQIYFNGTEFVSLDESFFGTVIEEWEEKIG